MLCTSQPSLTALDSSGNLRSQYQQRPLPVEQMACRASRTSTGTLFGMGELFNLASCPPRGISQASLTFYAIQRRSPFVMSIPYCWLKLQIKNSRYKTTQHEKHAVVTFPDRKSQTQNSRAPAGRSAVHAAIARAVAHHDGATLRTRRRIVLMNHPSKLRLRDRSVVRGCFHFLSSDGTRKLRS